MGTFGQASKKQQQSVAKLSTEGGASIEHDGQSHNDAIKNALDELSLDESVHYQAKTTKYIGNSLRSVTDPMFWYLMKTSHIVRGPWLHFYRFLCIKSGSERLHIVELVSRVISTIEKSFLQLMSNIMDWTTDAYKFANQVSHYSDGDVQFDYKTLVSVTLTLLIQSAAVFDRRIARTYSRRGFCFILEVK